MPIVPGNKWNLSTLDDADRDRHARSVRAVQQWARDVDVYITVDDAANIVNEVRKHWRADNKAECQRDLDEAIDRMRPYGRGDI